MGAKATGLDGLIDDLNDAADEAVDGAKKVVGKGSLNVKRDAKQRISGYAHLPHYPRAITYEVTARGMTVTGEIGPRRDRTQGGLGSYIELGTVNNAPIPHLAPALDAEEANFTRYVEELGAKLLDGKSGPDGPVTDSG